MGHDKASVLLGGVSLLQRVIDKVATEVGEVLVVHRADQTLPSVEATNLRFVSDVYRDRGPLGGLHAGFNEVTTWPVVALGCDAPFVEPGLLRELLRLAEAFDAAVPVSGATRQCLCAGYARVCLEPIANRLELGKLRLADFLDAVETRYLDEIEWRRLDPQGRSFININDWQELRRAEAFLA